MTTLHLLCPLRNCTKTRGAISWTVIVIEHVTQKHEKWKNVWIGSNLSPQKFFLWQVIMIPSLIIIFKVNKWVWEVRKQWGKKNHLFERLSTQFFDYSHNFYSTKWGWFVRMENIYYWIKVLCLFLAHSACFPNWSYQQYYVKKHVVEQTPGIRKSVLNTNCKENNFKLND